MTSTGPFRVWSETWKQWINHIALVDCQGRVVSHSVSVDDATKAVTHHIYDISTLQPSVEKNTGVKDVNCVEVFENDIVLVGGRKAVITLGGYRDDEHWDHHGWYCRDTRDSDGGHFWNHGWLGRNSVTVLGNVHQSPDLLAK